MIIQRTRHFKKAYQCLPEAVRRKVDKAILLFDLNPRHPSLHVEKINFEQNIWSGRVDINYRFTFQWIHGGILLRNLGGHQDVYRSL